jgi:alkanesulfonate monooxygenase SsuD/methylene tetrahydromethanopterin reductase-like flavin-dependent oxidoreductase (luciferase family)
VELAAHLPLMEFGEEGQSLARLQRATDAARECGFAAVSANDHLLFQTPWLDGLSALAALVDRIGQMGVATTLALPVLRGAVPTAKALAAIDLLSDGRLVAGLGPGSSKADYDAVGIPFEERWKRFEDAVITLRRLLGPESPLAPLPRQEGGIPLWIGSWGSEAGMRRVARLADGWLASAYNTTPADFTDGRTRLPDGFPAALATMWTWVTESGDEAERVLAGLASQLRREPDELQERLCIGPAAHCAELLSRYREAGCERVYIWPLGDEPRQIELVATATQAR